MPPLTMRAKNAAEAADRAEILAAFKKAGGVAQIAADLLGVYIRTMDRRIVELGLRDTLTKRYPPGMRPRPRKARSAK
jgi:transcriptional regulator with GAF, ATPase, and Fis domain